MKHLFILCLMLLPQVAAACPNCIGGNRNGSVLKLVGAFMLVPFAVCYVIIRVIRSAERIEK